MSDTHWLSVSLNNLKLEALNSDDDSKVGMDQTLDEFLQSTIDAATTGPSDLNGLIVLHASLRRWSAYARRAIKLLERSMTRPGYRDDGDAA